MSRPLPFVLPLLKVDATTGEFVAAAALEVRDDAGETFDYPSSKPHFEKMIKRSLAESAGKKEAPLRVMHQLIAAGKVLKHHFDDHARAITVHGQITDRAVLEKALDGTLCGVSMGGKKKYIGFGADGSRRYTAIPQEISLVDMGAIPGTAMTMLNAAGACEVTESDGTVRLVSRAAVAEATLAAALAADEETPEPDAAAADAPLANAAQADDADDADTETPPTGATDVSDADDTAALQNATTTDAMRGLRGRLQRMHDMSVEMGAACGALEKVTGAGTPEGEKTMTGEELNKAVASALTESMGEADGPLMKAIGSALSTALAPAMERLETLEKATGEKLEELNKATGEKLDALSARLKVIEDQPEPAKGVTHALTKANDGAVAEAVDQAAAVEFAKRDPIGFAAWLAKQPGNAWRIDQSGASPLALE